MKKREIILACVFFSDSSDSKVRPAIILSDDSYHSGGFLLVSAITTASDDYCLPIGDKESDCKLESGSGARFDGIIKLQEKQVIKTIGRISPEFHAKLVEKIIGMIKR